MTHYLRDHMGNTIVDIEATPDDISCVVDIYYYSLFLFARTEQSLKIIRDFASIQDIRGEYFESGWGGTPDDLARKRCAQLASKYDLFYVTD